MSSLLIAFICLCVLWIFSIGVSIWVFSIIDDKYDRVIDMLQEREIKDAKAEREAKHMRLRG